MPRHKKVLTGLLLTAGSVAGSVLVRRRAARRVDHVDLYAENGAVVSHAEGTHEADTLLAIAREVLPAR
jgi:hypothetical protein